MLNTTRLRVLREVAARGSIAGAADALWLTPSAVSQQMTALERELGVALLERTPRSVRLTGAGRRLVDHAERILADVESAVAEMETFGGEMTCTVRVSAFNTAAQAIVIPALVALRARHPSLTVHATDLEPHESMPALKAGALDVAIAHEYDLMPPFSDAGVERHELLAEPVYLVLPKRHPAAGAPARLCDLAAERFIVGQDATICRDAVIRAAHASGFEPAIELQSNDFRVIVAAVEAGLGAALVPRLADLRGFDVSVQPLAEPDLHRRIFAAVRRGSSARPPIAAVLGALADAAGHVVEAWEA